MKNRKLYKMTIKMRISGALLRTRKNELQEEKFKLSKNNQKEVLLLRIKSSLENEQ